MFEGPSCNNREDFYLNIDRVDAQPLLLYDDYRAGVMSLPCMLLVASAIFMLLDLMDCIAICLATP
jgi:hypothetical protein